MPSHCECDFSYEEEAAECWGRIQRCAGCTNDACEEHMTERLCEACFQYATGANVGIPACAAEEVAA